MTEEEQKNVLTKFHEEYMELCDKHKCSISATPQWISRDDGTFSMVLKMMVKKDEVEGG